MFWGIVTHLLSESRSVYIYKTQGNSKCTAFLRGLRGLHSVNFNRLLGPRLGSTMADRLAPATAWALEFSQREQLGGGGRGEGGGGVGLRVKGLKG